MFEPKGSEQDAPVPRRSVHFEQHEDELNTLMQQLNEVRIAESDKIASLEALRDEVHKARDCADSWENHLEKLRDRSDQYNIDLNETAVQFGLANDDLNRLVDARNQQVDDNDFTRSAIIAETSKLNENRDIAMKELAMITARKKMLDKFMSSTRRGTMGGSHAGMPEMGSLDSISGTDSCDGDEDVETPLYMNYGSS